MNILILGGAASGKSAFAEKKALELAEEKKSPLIYLATLNPQSGGDTAERIRKHRGGRKGKGFETVEWCECDFLPPLAPDGNPVVLLEDMGNLVANYLYPPEKPPLKVTAQDAVSFMLDTLKKISSRTGNFVCVTNEITLGGSLPEDVKFYGEVLARLNAAWAAECDQVYAVVAGIPLLLPKNSLC
ncbi:MAG: bifunctional adenosylcobinamide kinase/adenosylcobinamide-phosphate guanylyltransferase [Treponema sp.]|nr:bifunctional adenosylcobinamide kinase/adenosylcobinamide-phosphate guanylyltransferase [Treponema sp.]